MRVDLWSDKIWESVEWLFCLSRNLVSLLALNRLTALVLVLALLLPLMFFGETGTVSAHPNPPLVKPVIEMPAVLLAQPEPFQQLSRNSYQLSGKPSPLLVNFSVWDKISSLFSSTSKAETPANSVNSGTSETAPLLPTPTMADLSRARLSPKNQTGGTSLYSRNFSWGTGLVGLSGRGLNAGFGISYNSLIWTKSGSDIVFNPNNDNVTPGFRFGFPVIEPSYTDPLTSQTTYLMVTPSGGRVEFRLLSGSSDTFETADSSYTQLKVVDSNTLVVATTDGTQAVYTLKNGAFRCASIKDSNGNYITVNHDTNGLLQSVTDTLGREIDVSYNSGGKPTAITQSWSGGTHTYASFTYTTTTVNTSFSGLSLVGLTNNTSVKVLNKITFADSSFVTFDYNTYGQVWKISNYAADTHLLNYSAVNLDNSSISSGQTDCPRFTEFHNWTENFNLNSSNVAQEVVIPVSYTESQSFTLPDSSTVTGTLLQVTAPDGVVSKTYVGSGSSGWMEGVPVMTEDWVYESSSWVRKRWSYSAYTQDNTSLGYILNPRVTESKIGDSSNVKRTTIDYHLQSGSSTVALYGLVKDVIQYDTNGTSQLKKSHTEYNLDSNYTARRIIGLPAESDLYDGSNNLMSKVTYQYDEGNFSGTGQSVSAVSHDATNYGTGFSYRGNLTSTTRWDVNAPTNSSYAVTNSVKYNITGNPIAKTDPLNHTISISYTDNYDDSTNHNAYAFPTTLTDPASNSSTVKYRYETGANVYAESPAPAGQSYGKKTSRSYDSVGRLSQETVVNTGAYTRYEYPTNGIEAKSYSTIVDVNSNGADSNDEVLTESWTDGAGRVRMSKTEHPGSSGGWSAVITEYDIMGRVKRTSVPTEVNSSWSPAGDDSSRGYIWNAQEYDWKGRVTRQINTDGTDKLISYDGCGCAGGQVTTIQSELVPRDDSPSTNARRTNKVYEDILGRTYKTEALNWGGSVYATTKTTLNARDQATLIRQYSGSDSSSTYQDTTMTYDGHGRLYTQHRPEQSSSTNTTYSYYADNRIQQVTDARGATVSYTYNSRGLVTQISTTSPNSSTIPVTPTVNYSYDNMGNRTEMTDGLGSVTYEYDQLSHLTAETRQFSDTLSNAPLSSNRFKLEYGYSLSGQLKFYKDAYGQQINYSEDKVGRISSVTGSTSFGGVTTYANNLGYRSWGAVKHLEYGDDNAQVNMTFNNRLQTATYQMSQSSTTLMTKEYTYLPTGELSFNNDNLMPGNTGLLSAERFDRSFIYDHLGRTVETRTGAEARGSSDTLNKIPYAENFQYDALNHTLSMSGSVWTNTDIGFDEYDYTNNRLGNRSYNAEGDETGGGALSYSYESSGRMYFSAGTTAETGQYADGDGQEIKRTRRTRADEESSWSSLTVSYFIKSSVLGSKIVNEVKSDGSKDRAYVYGGETIIARQVYSGTTPQVDWEHYDASGMSLRFTSSNTSSGAISQSAELNSIENNVGVVTSSPQLPNKTSPFDNIVSFGMDRGGCQLDGIEADCSVALTLAAHGAARINEVMSDPVALRRINYVPTYGYRSVEKDHPNDPKDTIVIHTDEERYITGYIFGTNWSQQIGQQGPKYDEKVVKKAVNTAIELTKNKNCDEALKDITDGEIPSLNALVSKYLDANGNLAHISDGSTKSAGVFGTNNSNVPAFVEDAGTPQAHTYINSAFFDLGGNQLGNDKAKAVALIHEAVHQFIKEKNLTLYHKDIYYNENYSGGTYTKEEQEKGSKALTKLIVQKCYPVLKLLIDQLKNL